MRKKKKNEKHYSPIFVMGILTFFLALCSFVGSYFGMQGQMASIVKGTLETSLVTVKNILSLEGIQYLFSNIFSNETYIKLFLYLLISFVTLSIFESSGLASMVAAPLKKKSFQTITFLTLLISIISSFLGEYHYIFLLPFFAVLYKQIGRNPIIGIITSFLGLTMGSGAGVLFSYNDYFLGSLTELAAVIDIDKNFQYQLMSTFFIMFASALLLSFLGSIIVEKILIPRIPKYKKSEVVLEEYQSSKSALKFSLAITAVLILIIAYMIIPSLPGSGALLLSGEGNYFVALFGDSPFMRAFPFLVMILVLVASYLYGIESKNFKDGFDFQKGLNEEFSKTGYLFTLLFFYLLMMTVLDYTNLATVISVNVIDFVSKLQFSGLPLLITFFIVTVLLSMLIPSTITKWELMSPLIVPLLMRANITPNFTVFIYKAAEGIGKCITPFFFYFFVVLALLDHFDSRGEKNTMKSYFEIVFPSVLVFGILWLLIIVCWYIVGLPIGLGTYPTI